MFVAPILHGGKQVR